MDGFIYVFLAVLFGIATGVIGRAKGGSFLIWFMIGAVIPLFGLIAVILHRHEDNEPERECPTCGNVIKLYVQVCPRCGTDLYLPDPSQVRPGPAQRGV
jgi:endogenous inhibitor of DNA gyrase (YacG/DUF329 family)